MLGLQGCLSPEMLPGHGIRHLPQHRVAPTSLDAPTVLRWAPIPYELLQRIFPKGQDEIQAPNVLPHWASGAGGLKELGQEL